VFDTCADGRSLKCLTVVDEFTRDCLAIDVAGSIRSGRVIEILTRLVSVHGAPKYLRSDNGPEFVATAVLRWLQKASIETAFIDPGKPWQNGTDESFNGKFRDECLTIEWFRNRLEHRRAAGLDETVCDQWFFSKLLACSPRPRRDSARRS
jgi:putative transposase